jgi:hypothetical protein
MIARVSRDGDRVPQVSDAEALFKLPAGLANIEPFRSSYEVLGNGEQFIFNLAVDHQRSDDITSG